MPPMPATVEKVVQFRMKFGLDDDTNLQTQFKLGYTGDSPSSATLASLAGLVNTSFDGNLRSFLSSNGLLVGTFAKDLKNPATVEGFGVDGGAGTRAGNPPTVGVAAVVNFRPDRAYRGARPKMFTPFGIEADTTAGNSWSTAFVTDLQIAMNAFLAALAGESGGTTDLTVPMSVSYFHNSTVVISPTTGRARNVPTLRATPLVVGVLGLTVSQRLGSQRRRLKAA